MTYSQVMIRKIQPWVWQSLVLIILYILLGNSRSVQPNPFIPGAVIAVNMIIPVIGGILFGKRVGLLAGFFGTLINAALTGSVFEYIAIIPHSIMGFVAGYYMKKLPSPALSFSILIGHGLNIILFLAFKLIPSLSIWFWYGLAYESFAEILGIIVVTTLYKMIFEGDKKKKVIRRKPITEMSVKPIVWIFLSSLFLLLTALVVILFYFRVIFIVFIIGMALIIFVENMMKNFNQRVKNYKLKRWQVRIAGYVLVFFWLFTIYFLVGGSIQQLAEVAKTDVREVSSGYVTKIEPYIPTVLGERIFKAESIESLETWIFSSLKDFLSLITTIVLNAVLIIPLMFYMYFKKWKKIVARTNELLPKKFRNGAKNASSEISFQLRDYLGAKVIESTVIGGVCCLGFYVAGLKGWLFLAVFAGLLNIIPYIGPIIGAIPAILIALIDSPIVAIYVIVTVVIAQLLDNLYLIPFMISGKVKIDALLAIVLTLVGAQLAGPLGMILALPIFLVFKITLRETYLELVKIYKG